MSGVPEMPVAEDEGFTSGSVLWDDRLSGAVEWSRSAPWERPHPEDSSAPRGWLVWRGEWPWSVTPDLVDLAWSRYGIGVRVLAERGEVDLRLLRHHLPRMGRLQVRRQGDGTVSGWGVLPRARNLKVLEIPHDLDEEADLSRLFSLRRYSGPSHSAWGGVLGGAALEQAEVGEVAGRIEAPLRSLQVSGPGVTHLPELAHPESLRAVTVDAGAEFDLTSLSVAPWLQELVVFGRNLTGLSAVTALRKLTRVTLEGRSDEDVRVLSGIDAPDVFLALGPRPPQELVDVAIRRGWRIELSAREEREAYRRLGLSSPHDHPDTEMRWFEGVGEVVLSAETPDFTFTVYEEDLPPGMSGTEAERVLLQRVRERRGARVVRALRRFSTEKRVVLRGSTAAVRWKHLADEATALFDDHDRG
ncbi:hypothetical protein [Microbacterium sp. TNHR37B]|uniref:hypothetical protein n=1 Tax=Microbacterium sp. TNHR37B TaxID=1775956 RepID=UPI0007B1D077|nr:hypothetical protein [Microbacterium sp. TNHR37B]KZE89422.1 hypothetical protein AVP41_02216 [Microbacterium sp. TNHR37B]